MTHRTCAGLWCSPELVIAQSMQQFLGRSIRSLLERHGYWFRHRSVLPFGIDYQNDIRRLSSLESISIDTFFDVGANVGQTSSAALANFPGATIFAFEPDKSSFAQLGATIHSTRFRAFNIALSDRVGEARFFDFGALATSNSLVEDSQYATRAKHPSTVTTVERETIDAFCSRFGVSRIDVLKVDTEGHDLAVLRGASQMLSMHRVQFIYVEFNTMLPKTGTTGGALLPIAELLEPLGFRFVASYAEYMIPTTDLFVTSNALFVNTHR
jgi:FkbM family methyltransferase